MVNYFMYGGKRSIDFGIRIESYPETPFPERGYETYQVPGRSGLLVLDTGEYRNVTQTYECWYRAKTSWKFTSYEFSRYIADWLLFPGGYRILEDTYHPDFFRKAVYAGPANIESFFAKYGRMTMEFNCMPQKWLKSGQYQVSVQSGDVLYNNYMPALPLIQVTGSGAGVLGVGDSTVTISSIPEGGLTIDSESQNAYSGTQNCNDLITLGGNFPTLQNGATGISYSGGITAIQIMPRWWTL